MIENSYKTLCGCIHYFVNIIDKQKITLVFLPGLTADHSLFEKQTEYFAYDPDEYYASLQMGLPALHYFGRENPPHPEIWINYFLRMMVLYSKKVYELSKESENDELSLHQLK